MNLQPNSSLIGPPVPTAASPVNVTTKHLCFAATQGFDKNEQKSAQVCLLRMLIECSPRSCNFFVKSLVTVSASMSSSCIAFSTSSSSLLRAVTSLMSI